MLRFFKYDQRETRRTRLRVMHMRYVPQIHIYIYIHTQQKILLTYTSPLNRIIIHTIIIQVDVFVEIGCAIQKNMLLFLSIRILSFCNDIYIFVSRNINLLRTALFPISFSVLFQRNVLKIKKISTFDTILN